MLRRECYERYPFVASSLYQALCESKDRAFKRMRYLGTLRYMLPWMTAELDEIDDGVRRRSWPYGVEPNRPTLEALVQVSGRPVDDRQGAVKVDDLFVPVFEKTETPKRLTA